MIYIHNIYIQLILYIYYGRFLAAITLLLYMNLIFVSQSAIFPCRGFKVIAQAVELRRMMDSQISETKKNCTLDPSNGRVKEPVWRRGV